MSIKRIFAVMGIFLLACAAWAILGAAVNVRSTVFSRQLGDAVNQLIIAGNLRFGDPFSWGFWLVAIPGVGVGGSFTRVITGKWWDSLNIDFLDRSGVLVLLFPAAGRKGKDHKSRDHPYENVFHSKNP